MTALLAAWVFAAHASAVPQVLIVPDRVKFEKEDPNVDLGVYMADEIDKEGRAMPIVWSLTDTYFRAAVSDGLIVNPNEAPTYAEAQKAADRMRIEYVLQFAAVKSGAALRVRAKLYRRGKLLWQDPSKETNAELLKLSNIEDRLRREGKIEGEGPRSDPEWRELSVTLDDKFDVENASRSMARTWAILLANGPWKGLTAKPVHQTPDLDPGQAPKPNEEPLPPRVVDNKRLIEDVQRLLATNESMQAVILLRDAVDAEPFDAERRRMLVSALMNAGMPVSAAEEARRACPLVPSQVEFRIAAARGWIRAGNYDEAVKDLNEAVAREPNSPVTRGLLGEMALVKLDLPAALDHLNAALAAGDRADNRFMRGLALALAGETEESERDLEKATELGLPKDPVSERARFEMGADLVDAAAIKLGAKVRDAYQRARLNRTDAKIGPEVGALQSLAAGLRAVTEVTKAPERHQKSSSRRVLALNLLLQCVTELKDFLRTGDEDAIAESTLNLGEALKQVGLVREMHKSERSEEGANELGH